MDESNLLAILGQSLDNKNFRGISNRHKIASEKNNDQVDEKRVELEEGAKAFESYFVQSLLKEMRKGIHKERAAGSGYGEEIYRSLFDEAIATKISETGGIGLADLLIENLSGKP